MTAMFTYLNDVDYVFENFWIPKTKRRSFNFRKLNYLYNLTILVLQKKIQSIMTENVNRLLNRNRFKNNNTSFMKMKNNFYYSIYCFRIYNLSEIILNWFFWIIIIKIDDIILMKRVILYTLLAFEKISQWGLQHLLLCYQS